MNHIKSIIFDVGGTLLEGVMPWHELYVRALKLARHEVGLVHMMKCYEEALARLVQARRDPLIDCSDARRLLHELFAESLGLSFQRFQQAVDEVLYDHPQARHLVAVSGARQVLEELRRRGYRLAVISNWSIELPTTLGQLGLKDCFDGIFASEAIGHTKPDPAAFLLPVERLGLTPGVVAYVGDIYPIDIVGCREAGLTAVLVDPLGLGLHRDVPTIDHVAKLLDTFRGINGRKGSVATPPPA